MQDMFWLILTNFLAWMLLYLAITVESKWMKILCAVILVGGIVCIFLAKPDFIFANPTRSRIVNFICDVIGLIILYPKLKTNNKE